MSFDPEPGGRPRSTPIPGGDGPAPTPAQFLGHQPDLPWTPLPGRQVTTQFSVGQPASAPIDSSRSDILSNPAYGFAGARRSNVLRNVVIAFVLVTLLGTIGTIVFVSFAVDEATQRVRDLAAETGTTLGSPLTAPPSTRAPENQTGAPDPAGTLFAPGVAAAAMVELDQVLAGEPSELVQVVLTTDAAIATAKDPMAPGSLLAAVWRDGIPTAATVSSGGTDTGTPSFLVSEVDWGAVADLATRAPTLLALTDGQVSSVVVQRVGAGDPPAVVVRIIVAGASGSGSIDAAADGSVLAVNAG